MRVFIRDSSLFGLKRSLQKYGNDLVSSPESAELILTNDEVLPEVIRRELFGDINWRSEADSVIHWPDYFLTRFAFEGELSNQLAVGLPLIGMCNENLGAEEVGAVAVRFLPSCPKGDLFYNGLHMVLKEMKYTGFVSLSFLEGYDSPVRVQLGVPCGAIYALVESIRGSYIDFMLAPWRLFESWCVALPILRGCYPGKEAKKVLIQGISPENADHCFPFSDGLQSLTQFVGFVSASHGSLSTACYRVLEIARSLVIPEKQFRTDIEWLLKRKWWDTQPIILPGKNTSSAGQAEPPVVAG